MKVCALCKTEKPDDEFHWASKSRSRRHGYCKPCNRKKQRDYKRLARGVPLDTVFKPGVESKLGSVRSHKGYLYEKVGYDRSAHHRADKNGWVAQHILVAEKKYGILIKTGFTVHHRNRKTDDNQPENLELRVGQHGKGGDLMPTLLIDTETRKQAVTVLWQMGYEIFYPGDRRNVGKKKD